MDLKMGEADAETIHAKMQEFFAALTPWSVPQDTPSQLPEAARALAEGLGIGAVHATNDAHATGGQAPQASTSNDGGADLTLLPTEITRADDLVFTVGEQWVVFSSLRIKNCVSDGTQVFIRKDQVLLKDNTILEADVMEVLEVHSDDSTLKMKFCHGRVRDGDIVLPDATMDGVAFNLCFGKVASAATVDGFTVGQAAVLDGLVSRPDLSGHRVTLRSFDAATSRWEAVLDGSHEVFRVKSFNLIGVGTVFA